MSMLRFRAALRSRLASSFFDWLSGRYDRAIIYWYRERWRFPFKVEWNSVHIAPILPPWRWTWQVPWQTSPQLLETKPRPPKKQDHLWVQIIVLKFEVQFGITRDVNYPDRLFSLIATAVGIFIYFKACR